MNLNLWRAKAPNHIHNHFAEAIEIFTRSDGGPVALILLPGCFLSACGQLSAAPKSSDRLPKPLIKLNSARGHVSEG
jgi:hypothetical protein